MVPFYVFMHGYFFSACPPISEPSSRACQEKYVLVSISFAEVEDMMLRKLKQLEWIGNSG